MVVLRERQGKAFAWRTLQLRTFPVATRLLNVLCSAVVTVVYRMYGYYTTSVWVCRCYDWRYRYLV